MASQTARRLRANQTEVEKRLWARPRNRGLFDIKFRRQVPLGSFVADFVCADRGIIVELDGGQHSAAKDADRRRTAWLESHVWRVVRFWNSDIVENIEGVLQMIAGACGIDVDHPHPDPLPGGEGEARSPLLGREGEARGPLPGGEGEIRSPLRGGEGEGTSGGTRPRRMLGRGYAPRGSH